MLLRLCQLKSLIIILTLISLASSCTGFLKKDSREREVLTDFPHQWFEKTRRHAIEGPQGGAVPHLLFDVDSEFEPSTQEVNVVITTPQGSPHAYDIDLTSGQRFYTHSYCKQADVWKSYSGSVSRPPYSVAYMPKVLDQMGEPQKVILWSHDPEISQILKTNYFRVRLIGAYVEQMCPQGNCLGRDDWLSKLVFLAVDANDEDYNKLKNIDDFKKLINWEETKAHLANLDGLNFIGNNRYPYKQIGEPISFEKAFKYFKKRSIFLTNKELKKIQEGCHELYNAFLEYVSKERPEDLPAKNIKELEAKIKLHKSLIEKKLPIGFSQRLAVFVKKYFKEISTCEKFVYHGNINYNTDDFWFLSYMGIFFRLHREGYYYDCKNHSWKINELNVDGKLTYSLEKNIENCSAKNIDQAMGYLENFINSFKNEDTVYRFIDYDNHSFGTHKKLYSWVKVQNRKFDCWDNSKNQFLKNIQLVPENKMWKKRYEEDISEKLKVIY